VGDFIYFICGALIFVAMMAYAVRANRLEARRRKDHAQPRFPLLIVATASAFARRPVFTTSLCEEASSHIAILCLRRPHCRRRMSELCRSHNAWPIALKHYLCDAAKELDMGDFIYFGVGAVLFVLMMA